MKINEVFKYLEEFRKLPKYQLERRLDIFLVPHLESVCSKFLNEEIKLIYPEFPLHCINQPLNVNSLDKISYEEIKKLNKVEGMYNTNVDYLLASENSIYLTELKTDASSFNELSQLIYYLFYANASFQSLVNFFKELSEKQKKKWDHGYKYFCKTYYTKINHKVNQRETNEIKILYIGPESIKNSKEYKIFSELLGNKLEFISLEKFGETINDKELKNFLLNMKDSIPIDFIED